MNYLFNSSINGIEKSDLILLVGCNPRHEATILNARIRKAFRNNKTPIFFQLVTLEIKLMITKL